MKYRVYGNTTVTVAIEVYAESEEGALDAAANELCALSAYAGNGDCDKIIGVDLPSASVASDDDIEWDDVELIDNSDDEDDDD